MATVTFDGVTRFYPDTAKPAVDRLTLEIEDGEFLVLVGPSGSGKSTALRQHLAHPQPAPPLVTRRAFSAREAIAPDLRPVLCRETPRDPQDWPDGHPQQVADFHEAMVPPDLPLRGLARALFFGFLGLGKELGQPVPDIRPDATIAGAEGLTMIYDMFGHLLPNLGGPA